MNFDVDNGQADARDVYFIPIADAIIDVAKRHNLLISRYYHDVEMWSLCFTHPKGGHVRLDVMRESATSVTLVGCWWLDDYQRFTRNLKGTGKIPCAKSAEQISDVLERLLMIVLRWQLDDWTQIATGYEKSWSPYTQEQFEAMAPRWPVAR
jgi:hypothetical protein